MFMLQQVTDQTIREDLGALITFKYIKYAFPSANIML